MIGHYLLTLTPEAENAVLTRKMDPGSYFTMRLGEETTRCLVGCASGFVDVYGEMCSRPWHRPGAWGIAERGTVESRYDDICKRFTTGRVNAAIRNRILTNQARRELLNVETPLVGKD